MHRMHSHISGHRRGAALAGLWADRSGPADFAAPRTPSSSVALLGVSTVAPAWLYSRADAPSFAAKSTSFHTEATERNACRSKGGRFYEGKPSELWLVVSLLSLLVSPTIYIFRAEGSLQNFCLSSCKQFTKEMVKHA